MSDERSLINVVPPRHYCLLPDHSGGASSVRDRMLFCGQLSSMKCIAASLLNDRNAGPRMETLLRPALSRLKHGFDSRRERQCFQ